jgi:hypothetical protein
MKLRTKVKAGSPSANHNAKKLSVKRVRGGVTTKSGVKAGQKG